jgi:hypothetical protein
MDEKGDSCVKKGVYYLTFTVTFDEFTDDSKANIIAKAINLLSDHFKPVLKFLLMSDSKRNLRIRKLNPIIAE